MTKNDKFKRAKPNCNGFNQDSPGVKWGEDAHKDTKKEDVFAVRGTILNWTYFEKKYDVIKIPLIATYKTEQIQLNGKLDTWDLLFWKSRKVTILSDIWDTNNCIIYMNNRMQSQYDK